MRDRGVVIPAFLCLWYAGCADNSIKDPIVAKDPIVSLDLMERRGEYTLVTGLNRWGHVFRGYGHRSNNIYEKTTEFDINPKTNRRIWSLLWRGTIATKFLEFGGPEGDFKTIGVKWKQLEGSTYGVSYAYDEVSKDSPLFEILKIVQDIKLDSWEIPKLNTSISKADIMAGTNAGMGSVTPCLKAARARREISAGQHTLFLNWTIKSDGTVHNSSVIGPDYVLATTIPACFVDGMRSWSFPATHKMWPVRNFPFGPFNVQ